MCPDPKQRIKEIQARLNAYNKHRSDPYDFFPKEISAVHELENCAPDDIKFLLEEIKILKNS